MRVRITLARTIRQYADIVIADVESVAEAVETVEADLKVGPQRARRMQDVKWFGDELVEDVCVLGGDAKQ